MIYLQVVLVILVVLFPRKCIFIFLLPKLKMVDAKLKKVTADEDLKEYSANEYDA